MLIVNGKPAPCSIGVHSWFDHGLTFRNLGTRKHTRKIMLHWTGGRRDARGLHDTLLERGLSVHFCIDADGKVAQYCDTKHRCSHAGQLEDGVTSANDDTIGIEIVNHASEKQLGPVRPMVTERIHGRDVTHTDFFPAQIVSALTLIKALCAAYSLPYAVPTNMAGELITTFMLRARWEAFRGVVGHLHVRDEKTDPGLGILLAVQRVD